MTRVDRHLEKSNLCSEKEKVFVTVISRSNYVSRSDKKLLNQMNDLMRKKHHLRLLELEESVLQGQVNHQV